MQKILVIFVMLSLYQGSILAQMNRVIEPAILEVRYDSWQKEHDDAYILRVGKTVSQFFSYFQNRTDSMDVTSEVTSKIALKEFLEADDRSPDRSKRLKASTISRELIYQNLTTGKLTLYSNYAWEYYTYEEDIPQQEWLINLDSTKTILGQKCHYATTVSWESVEGLVRRRNTSKSWSLEIAWGSQVLSLKPLQIMALSNSRQSV